MGRRHYRVRHRRRFDEQRRAEAQPRPGPAPQEPQAVLEWAALRRVQPLPLAVLVLRWLVIAFLCLAVLDVARAAGVPIVLIVLVWAGSAAVRGRRRASHKPPDRRHQPTPAAPAAPRPARPAAPRRVAGGPPRGSPYDLETYLKRLGEDGR